MDKRIYSAKVESVNKALDLLRSGQAGKVAKKYKKIASNINEKFALHCSNSKLHNSHIRTRKKAIPSSFSRKLVAIEMRKCLMRHDWANIKELLPLLLKGRIEIEPLIWRYLFTELLYSPKGTSQMLNHFLEMCAGTQNSEFIKQILTLPSRSQPQPKDSDPI